MGCAKRGKRQMTYYTEPAKQIPVREYDVVVAGAGTGGVIAAIAAARQGARTAVIEAKGYAGGTAVDGGTALHSFFNLARAFGVERRQVVKGLPAELIERLSAAGGCTGFAPMEQGFQYDEVNTSVDVEVYKLVAAEWMEAEGVDVYYNSLVAAADVADGHVNGVIVQSRKGREYFKADAFIDCTGFGDLCAWAGARFTEPNDHATANSIGVAGVSVEGYYDFIRKHNAVEQICYAERDGNERKLVRVQSFYGGDLPKEFVDTAKEIGMHSVITTTHDDYFMFLKLNYRMEVSPVDRDAVNKVEVELRRRQRKAVELFRKFVPGCENAFIARSAPSILIRRGRCIECDYDLSLEDIVEGRHFEDDVMAYGFHDCAPRIQIKNGQTYGIPYRALLPKGLDNLFATGMMITTDWYAQMSTRNTVSCMAQGQAAGIAAALASQRKETLRQLPYPVLHQALLAAGVHLEN